MKKSGPHLGTWITVLPGAVASVALLLYIGRRNQSQLLRVLFSLWVLGPALLYSLLNTFLKQWALDSQPALDRVMQAITIVSVAIYASVLVRGPAKPAAAFVAIPPVACLVLAVVVARSALSSRRR